MRRWWLVVVVWVVAGLGRAHAQKAEAEAAFERGRVLMANGETAKACAEFETSMRFDPENGTLYNLAVCHAALGKTATAWSELKELAATDTNPARAKDAARRASSLAPKLTHMRLRASAAVPGEVVMRDDVDVTTLVGQDTPVDPGHYTFVARAPGREPATVTAELAGAGTVDVEIPELRAAGTAGPAAVEPTGYPMQLPQRPLVLPGGMWEFASVGTIASGQKLKQNSLDSVSGARGAFDLDGYGTAEVEADVDFHVIYPDPSSKPNQPSSLYLAARYAYRPMLAFAIDYANIEPRGGGPTGSDLRALGAYKQLVGASVALEGRAGLEYVQSKLPGDYALDSFGVFGEGKVQLAATSRISFEAAALFYLQLGGQLYTDAFRLAVGGTGLVAVTQQLDAFASASFAVLPSSDPQVYVIGAAWRTR